ncbi:hypothetical protein, partial [Klebsiella variicola]|uniref:hypothetical protein n=1 Tax=Klebsiella variicola TaxID=244366 RepID=UPI0039C2D129
MMGHERCNKWTFGILVSIKGGAVYTFHITRDELAMTCDELDTTRDELATTYDELDSTRDELSLLMINRPRLATRDEL